MLFFCVSSCYTAVIQMPVHEQVGLHTVVSVGEQKWYIKESHLTRGSH